MNMDNNRKACNICNKRVLNHSYHLQCDICQCFVHLKCLPYVTREDDLYVKRKETNGFVHVAHRYYYPSIISMMIMLLIRQLQRAL